MSGETEATRWHALAADDVARMLRTDATSGLSAAEAARRLASDGPNALPDRGRAGWPALLARQFRSVLVAVLIAAAAVSLLAGDAFDAAAIVAILLLNATLGFVQEFRADRTLAALDRLVAPEATVTRDGRTMRRPAAEVVTGDLIELNAGDTVPADARLVSGAGIRVTEAALTGESMPVTKAEQSVDPAAPLAERASMLYRGSLVVGGRGRALVTETGARTEIGRIAHLAGASPEERTPLEVGLDRTARRLVMVALAAATLVFVVGSVAGAGLADAFLVGVALAVAAIPEGLPAAITIVLALGVRRMAGRHAVVRRLAAVETLGSVDVICADKTGTLTRNELSIRSSWQPDGDTGSQETRLAAALAVGPDPVAGVIDPTDLALLAFAGPEGEAARQAYAVVVEHSFDAVSKRSSVVRRVPDGHAAAFVKGAPEAVLDAATHVMAAGGSEPLEQERRAEIEAAITRMATAGMRPIGLARRELAAGEPVNDPGNVGRGLALVAVVGMIDALRPEAVDAARRAQSAGIRTVMITGDHPATAAAIAADAGIGRASGILTGPQLQAMREDELDEACQTVDVYARVTSEDKLRIVRALKRSGAVVAMTGDGVNDAPALREAHIGVAMGMRGTDVAREAADLVLTDDNYDTIVAAVEEGRRIVANIQRFLGYLVAGNAAEIVVITLGAFTGAVPLLPVQILWVNLITDGLPALALGVEPPEPDAMRRPPRPARASMLSLASMPRIATSSLLVAVPTLVAFAVGWQAGPEQARNLAFATLVTTHVVTALTFRSATVPLLRLGLLGNKPLLAAVVGALTLQAAVFYVAPLGAVLSASPLSAREAALVLGLSAPALVVPELIKALRPGVFGRTEPAPKRP